MSITEKKKGKYEEDYVLRDGRPRDPIHGGVYTRTWCQGCRLREKILRERGGSSADKRCTDPPRGAGRSRYTRSYDNRPGPTVRSSQPDSRQGWDSKVALWIYLAYEFAHYIVFFTSFRYVDFCTSLHSSSVVRCVHWILYLPRLLLMAILLRNDNVLPDISAAPPYRASNVYVNSAVSNCHVCNTCRSCQHGFQFWFIIHEIIFYSIRSTYIVQDPHCYLVNWRGFKRAPVRLETSLSVKSSIVTKEEVTVARGGKVVDERSRETKENNYYASSTSEIWEPVGIIHRPRNIKPFDSSDDSRPNSNASSDQGYTTSSNHVLRERGGASTAGCPICEDNDPECARRCLGGLTGLGREKVSGVRTTTSVVS